MGAWMQLDDATKDEFAQIAVTTEAEASDKIAEQMVELAKQLDLYTERSIVEENQRPLHSCSKNKLTSSDRERLHVLFHSVCITRPEVERRMQAMEVALEPLTDAMFNELDQQPYNVRIPERQNFPPVWLKKKSVFIEINSPNQYWPCAMKKALCRLPLLSLWLLRINTMLCSTDCQEQAFSWIDCRNGGPTLLLTAMDLQRLRLIGVMHSGSTLRTL